MNPSCEDVKASDRGGPKSRTPSYTLTHPHAEACGGWVCRLDLHRRVSVREIQFHALTQREGEGEGESVCDAHPSPTR